MNHKNLLLALSLSASLTALGACSGDHDDDGHNENEVITTVTLTFAPMGGGPEQVFSFDDADGDGGDPPVIDTIDLTAGDYIFMVRFANGLEDPPEDITPEIADESGEHQLFFTGTAVDGPANTNPGAPLIHAYDDLDAAGLPVGLANTATAAPGSGDLTITLRHLPPINGEDVKVADIADQVANEGFAAIGGSSDAQVTLPVNVQ